MASKKRTGTGEMTIRRRGEKIRWEDLLLRAARETYGRTLRLHRSFDEEFISSLFSEAKNINPRAPVEISKNTVDINEKIYSNHEGSEDETTVKIVNCVENSEGHNYQDTTTNGIQWNASTNVGLQFGLPQVGVGPSGGLGIYQFSKGTNNKVELQSHHQEVAKIPPGKKVIVKMTSSRVRYKLEYTMEYKIAKTARIPITFDLCGRCCGIGRRNRYGSVAAERVMQHLPGFREDEEFVYSTQEGELRWIAERMEVEKTIVPV